MTTMRPVTPWYRPAAAAAALILATGATASVAAQSRPVTQASSQAPAGQQPAAGQQAPAKPAAPTPGTAQPAPQTPPQAPPKAPPAPSTLRQPAPQGTPRADTMQSVTAPADYLIGPDDVLQIVFWQEKDLSAEVTVRPDGRIALPLINEVQAAGLTPADLRTSIMKAASRYVTDPSLTIFTKAINSRKVFVTGMVGKAGPYLLNDSMTVLQMLANAGGLLEYAKSSEIVVMRVEQGQTKSFKFNYKDVVKGKNLQQNIVLKPGDTIVVP
jgi:polysaccharide export outer membrane protein